ncbi:glycerophosphodiester phosphodiesterase [Cyanobacteria bacterium FACHB-502]|nr:glycerophosphodiester phosphodiesterase [Cyanobacteria bacterium FACHB-502]MBD2023211.1 glycerophosphodiester phosphodiesterase [Leptolyngbya sp. FACHB-711]
MPPSPSKYKFKESGYEAEVLEALQPLHLETFVITSFRLEVIDRVKQLSPQITIGFLIDAKTIDLLPDANSLNEKLNAIAVDFLAPNWQILDHPIVAQLSPQIFWVWTVNEAIVMQQLIAEARSRDRQIAAIITDEPEMGFAMASSRNAANPD